MLTDTIIRRARPQASPVKLSDGGGLCLMVTPSGGKLWRYNHRFGGKQINFYITLLLYVINYNPVKRSNGNIQFHTGHNLLCGVGGAACGYREIDPA